jgi:hypothetical protein
LNRAAPTTSTPTSAFRICRSRGFELEPFRPATNGGVFVLRDGQSHTTFKEGPVLAQSGRFLVRRCHRWANKNKKQEQQVFPRRASLNWRTCGSPPREYPLGRRLTPPQVIDPNVGLSVDRTQPFHISVGLQKDRGCIISSTWSKGGAQRNCSSPKIFEVIEVPSQCPPRRCLTKRLSLREREHVRNRPTRLLRPIRLRRIADGNEECRDLIIAETKLT